MKALILALLFSANAHAGTIKVHWTHDNKATDGSTVVLTGFKIYWGLNDAGNTNVIPLGPPAPLAWKVVSGMYYFAKTLSNPLWVPGSQICLQMTAVADDLESNRSGQVCKVMPLDPSAPTVIDIDTP